MVGMEETTTRQQENYEFRKELMTQRREYLTGVGATLRTPAEAAQRALEHVNGQSEYGWDQTAWFAVDPCGTSCCVAGFIAADTPGLQVIADRYGAHVADLNHRQAGGVAVTAQTILDLDDYTAAYLFDPLRKKEQIEAVLQAVVDGNVYETVTL